MQAVLGAELRDRQLAPDRLECYFRFEFSVIKLACRLGHLYSSFPKDEPSLSYCPIRGDLLRPPTTNGLGRQRGSRLPDFSRQAPLMPFNVAVRGMRALTRLTATVPT